MKGRFASRALSGADISRAHRLISAVWLERRARSYLHLGDLYWALRPGLEFVPERDIRVWCDGEGEAIAFAWFDGPASGEFIVAPDETEDLELDAIEWLEDGHRAYASALPFGISALDDDDHRTTLLTERGYARSEEGAVRFWQKIGESRAVAPPGGFVVRSIEGDQDIERRVFAQTTSFERSTATVEVWRGLMELPGYRDDLDLIAVAPDGTGAGGCTCWYDEANRSGEFEPVGTSKAYQRLGVGKALIGEGLRRLRSAGATEAIVQTNITNAPAIALYRSCAFELAATQHRWEKAL